VNSFTVNLPFNYSGVEEKGNGQLLLRRDAISFRVKPIDEDSNRLRKVRRAARDVKYLSVDPVMNPVSFVAIDSNLPQLGSLFLGITQADVNLPAGIVQRFDSNSGTKLPRSIALARIPSL